MIQKHFVSETGTLIGNCGEDHADHARAYLKSQGIVAKDYADLYIQMFKLGFGRVLQDETDFFIESPNGLSEAQHALASSKWADGFRVFINDQAYSGSKAINAKVASAREQTGRKGMEE